MPKGKASGPDNKRHKHLLYSIDVVVAKGRHAKTRQNQHLACFRVATFRPGSRKREKAPRENPLNSAFVVFSHGELSPRHTKVREI